MEKIKLMQTVGEALWSVADDDVGVLSLVELREIVEGDTPLNAAMSVYMCGTTLGARLERKNPGKANLYHEPEEMTAAEYKKELEKENPGADQDEPTDEDMLFLLFNNALEGLKDGDTPIKADVISLCERTGTEQKSPMGWLIKGFVLGACEGMSFYNKAREAVKDEVQKKPGKQLLDIEEHISGAELSLNKAATIWADIGDKLDLDKVKPTQKGQETFVYSFEDIVNEFDIVIDYIRSARDELQEIVI